MQVPTGTVNADFGGTVSTSGLILQPGAVPTVNISGNYTRFAAPDAAYRFYLGNATDPANYHDNASHVFRSVGGASIYATLNSTGLGVGVSPVAAVQVLHVSTNPSLSSGAGVGLAVHGTARCGCSSLRTWLCPKSSPVYEVFRINIMSYWTAPSGRRPCIASAGSLYHDVNGAPCHSCRQGVSLSGSSSIRRGMRLAFSVRQGGTAVI